MKLSCDVSYVQLAMRHCLNAENGWEQPRRGLKTVRFSRENQEVAAK